MSSVSNRSFVTIGGGLLVLAGVMAAGAAQIKGEAGYAGVGPAFLPWLVTMALAALGVVTIVASQRHSAPLVEAPEAVPRWVGLTWVSAGLLLNALLIEHVGFVVSCALLFALAARGFRLGSDQRPGLLTFAKDFALGVVVSAPVFWMFTRILGLSLPALFRGGWV